MEWYYWLILIIGISLSLISIFFTIILEFKKARIRKFIKANYPLSSNSSILPLTECEVGYEEVPELGKGVLISKLCPVVSQGRVEYVPRDQLPSVKGFEEDPFKEVKAARKLRG